MLGGKHPQARIEVHDVVFTAADRLEDTYPQLREAWFGSQDGLHIDSWLEVDGISDCKVELSAQASAAGLVQAAHRCPAGCGGLPARGSGEEAIRAPSAWQLALRRVTP